MFLSGSIAWRYPGGDYARELANELVRQGSEVVLVGLCEQMSSRSASVSGATEVACSSTEQRELLMYRDVPWSIDSVS